MIRVRDDRFAGLVDAALGKVARQSSQSIWSVPDEASRACSGARITDFAFHTSEEDRPSWTVDLGDVWPIEAIVIHNRVACERQRAFRLRVEIACRPDQWILVHAGFANFGIEGDGEPLSLWVGGELDARWVRISLDERNALHLSKVEVLVEDDRYAFTAFCQAHGLERLRSGRTHTAYKVVGSRPKGRDSITGLTIDYSGRFGNLLHQYINAILLAQRTGLRFLRLGQHELLDVGTAACVEGITLLPAGDPLPDGLFLSGEFFNSDDFAPVLSPFLRFEPQDERAATRAVQTFIVPHLLTGIPVAGEQHPLDELTIHLRSGDIFNSDHPVTYGYRQPPLSFYVLVVERMLARGITRVRLVSEDRGNPCVDALEAWLRERGVPTRSQSVSLRADMSALVDAPHLVFGHGTFGYAAVRLSKAVKTLHYFGPELGGAYGFISVVDEVFEVTDAAGGYIKAFEYGKPYGPEDGWRNTPAMRQKMLTYPGEALQVREVPREARQVHAAAQQGNAE